MKLFMAFTLISLGALWVFLATIDKAMVRTSAYSDAMSFEAELHKWTSQMISDGKLQSSDVDRLYVNGELAIAGENPNHNFETMIIDIAESGSPSLWPGLIAVFVGVLGISSVANQTNTKKQKAEQDAPNSQ